MSHVGWGRDAPPGPGGALPGAHPLKQSLKEQPYARPPPETEAHPAGAGPTRAQLTTKCL